MFDKYQWPPPISCLLKSPQSTECRLATANYFEWFHTTQSISQVSGRRDLSLIIYLLGINSGSSKYIIILSIFILHVFYFLNFISLLQVSLPSLQLLPLSAHLTLLLILCCFTVGTLSVVRARSRWSSRTSHRSRSSIDLLYKVKHGWVNTKTTHEHSLIDISRWKVDSFFP